MPYYDDDGNELDPTTIPIPKLCLSCEKKDDIYEEILCNLNRLDQISEDDFKCGVYESIYGTLEEEMVE
ncbi:MAG: hypothetical protein AAB336_00940 [Acidobacteriota bacterium]